MVAAATLTLGVHQAQAETSKPTATKPSVPAGAPMKAIGEVKADSATPVNPTDVKSGSFAPPQQQPPAPKPTVPKHILDAAKAAARNAPGARRETAGTASKAQPTNQLSFEGLNQGSSGLRPPDTHGAVGINHFVEITNGTGLGFYNKATGALISSVTLNDFFRYQTNIIFDPRVVYDKVWNRWVIFAESLPESPAFQFVFLAVSQTTDPTGPYWKFSFDVPEVSNVFFDYPQLGMNQDALIITGNVFSGDTYIRSSAFGIPKAAAYNGQGWAVPYFTLGTPGTVAPPIIEGNNASAYLIAADPGTEPNNLQMFVANNLGLNTVSIVFHALISVDTFGIPPNAEQPGTTDLLDSLDGRFQNNSTQIGDRLLNVHTIDVDGFPTPRWYEINTTTGTVPAGRTGLFFESGTSDDFNPAIVGSPIGGTSANPIARMFFTWTSTDASDSLSSHQARVKGSGRLATDPADTVGGLTFAEATTFYNPSIDIVERWGDYSAVTMDPVAVAGCPAGQRAWLVNERQISTTLWGSRFGRIGYC
jgi:hypothetical protein